MNQKKKCHVENKWSLHDFIFSPSFKIVISEWFLDPLDGLESWISKSAFSQVIFMPTEYILYPVTGVK